MSGALPGSGGRFSASDACRYEPPTKCGAGDDAGRQPEMTGCAGVPEKVGLLPWILPFEVLPCEAPLIPPGWQ